MKHLCTKILLAMLISMMGINAFAHDIEVENTEGIIICYNLNKDKMELTVTFHSHGFVHYSGTVIIPESVIYEGKTYRVTSIGDNAFSRCSGLTSITIPNSITSIGDGAFSECSSLISIEIPNSVLSIGNSVFFECSKLEIVNIPSSVKTVGSSILKETKWIESQNNGWLYLDGWLIGYKGFSTQPQNLEIIEGTKGIARGAISGCRSLTSVIIPPSVCFIGEEAFSKCKNLNSINIPQSVLNIGRGAFLGCSSLNSISVENDNMIYDSRENCNAIIESSTNTLITGCNNTIIPSNVESIADLAFHSGRIVTVSIPNSVKSIGELSFAFCTDLTTVTIGNSVTSIGNHAFRGCSSLTSVTIPHNVSNLGWNAFSECTSLKSAFIENGLTAINADTFSDCYDLSSLSIGNSVTSIGNGAFRACNSLTSISIPNSVTNIEDHAFEGCGGLTSITLGNSITSIGAYAFSGCGSLTSIKIPKSVTDIGNNAFYGCNNIREVISYITEPAPCKELFSEETYRQGILYIPGGTFDLYTRFDGWKEFLKIIEMDADGEQLYLTFQSGNQGKVKLAAKRGQNYTILFEPENGWKINCVTFNGIDVTNQLVNQNQFTTPAITDNAILSVTYEQTAQGIRTYQISDIKVIALSNTIQIENAQPGSICQVYSVGGELTESTVLSNGNANIQVPTGHIYIVKVGKSVFKVGL